MADNVIFLSNVRLSFPHIAEPQRTKRDDGTDRVSYSTEFIMAPNHPGYAQVMALVGTMMTQKWAEHAGNVWNLVQSDRKKRGFGQGDEKINQKTFKVYDGYAGQVFITAGRDQMPQIINADGSAVDPTNTMACQAIARKMYGGCYVNAAVKPWLQDNKHGKGIRFDLVAVQFAGDGPAFGEGATDASGMFGAVAAAPAAAPAPAMPGAPFAAPPGIPSFLQ